jgi:hypothetical protein
MDSNAQAAALMALLSARAGAASAAPHPQAAPASQPPPAPAGAGAYTAGSYLVRAGVSLRVSWGWLRALGGWPSVHAPWVLWVHFFLFFGGDLFVFFPLTHGPPSPLPHAHTQAPGQANAGQMLAQILATQQQQQQAAALAALAQVRGWIWGES